MDVNITNAAELKLEIIRLKESKIVQETAIKQRFNSPRAILGIVTSFFNKNKPGNGLASHNIVGLISKFLLPFKLNKTLFRKWGITVWDKISPHLPASLLQKIAPKKRPSFFGFLSRKKQNKLKPV